jgi:hypothetical protein
LNISKNIKKALKIETKVLIKKLFSKVISKISDYFKELSDKKRTTYELYRNLELLELELISLDFVEYDAEWVKKTLECEISIFGKSISLELLDDKTADFCKNKNQIPLKYINSDYKYFNWDKDYISGYQWDGTLWHKKIKYGNFRGADIKVPWEIGRLQFLLPLAIQSTKSKDSSISENIKEIILSFIVTNPPRFGTQWMTSMDIAIRAINLLLTLNVFHRNDDNIFDKEEEMLVLSYLVQHGLHIENNLEYSQGMRGNHYFANIIGILVCAVMIRNYPQREAKIEKYTKELLTEVRYQFGNDGVNFEASIPYHFFVFEMFDFAINLLNQAEKELNLSLAKSYHELTQLYGIIKAASCGLIYFNHIPQIGDNDGGYLYNTFPTDDISEIKNGILKRLNVYNNQIGYNNYQDSGIYSNNRELYYFISRCGKIGQNGKGGHDHNDHTSFELYVKGRQVIVDPGTYNYTAYFDERNKYRSAQYHNIFAPLNEEQNLFDNISKDDLFWIREERTKGKIIQSDSAKFVATHEAYHTVCIRDVRFEDTKLYFSDTIEKSGNKILRLFFAPGLEIKYDEDSFLVIGDKTLARIKCINQGRVVEYDYSKSYFYKEKAFALEFMTHEKNLEWIIEILD